MLTNQKTNTSNTKLFGKNDIITRQICPELPYWQQPKTTEVELRKHSSPTFLKISSKSQEQAYSSMCLMSSIMKIEPLVGCLQETLSVNKYIQNLITDLTLNIALYSISTLNWTLYIVSILYPINCLPFFIYMPFHIYVYEYLFSLPQGGCYIPCRFSNGRVPDIKEVKTNTEPGPGVREW